MSPPLTPTLRRSPPSSKATRSPARSPRNTSPGSQSSQGVAQLESTIAALREELNREKNSKETDAAALAAIKAELTTAQDNLATLTAPLSPAEPEPDAPQRTKKLIGWFPA